MDKITQKAIRIEKIGSCSKESRIWRI